MVRIVIYNRKENYNLRVFNGIKQSSSYSNRTDEEEELRKGWKKIAINLKHQKVKVFQPRSDISLQVWIDREAEEE